mgnify:CR=1 FL=1
MNKGELIDELAKVVSTKKEAQVVVDCVLSSITNALKKERVLVVPGSGFDGPGHFRIAFCVDDEVIKNSMPGFQKALERYK